MRKAKAGVEISSIGAMVPNMKTIELPYPKKESFQIRFRLAQLSKITVVIDDGSASKRKGEVKMSTKLSARCKGVGMHQGIADIKVREVLASCLTKKTQISKQYIGKLVTASSTALC